MIRWPSSSTQFWYLRPLSRLKQRLAYRILLGTRCLTSGTPLRPVSATTCVDASFRRSSQYSHLITRRLRELNVYAEMLPCTQKIAGLPFHPKGVILSGSPYSVYDKDAPHVDPAVFDLGVSHCSPARKKKKRVKNFLGPHSRSLLRSPGDCLEPRTGRLRW